MSSTLERQTAVCLHNVLLLGDERELTAGTRNSKAISRLLMRKVLDGLMYKKFQNSRPLEVESRPVELGWGQLEDVDPRAKMQREFWNDRNFHLILVM